MQLIGYNKTVQNIEEAGFIERTCTFYYFTHYTGGAFGETSNWLDRLTFVYFSAACINGIVHAFYEILSRH